MFKIFSIYLLNKYLKCSVWRLALRYDIHIYIYIYIYIYISLGFKRLKCYTANMPIRNLSFLMAAITVFRDVTPYILVKLKTFQKTLSHLHMTTYNLT